VIKGKALISLRKFNSAEVLSFNMDGDKPSFVDMPIWFTHSIMNTGKEDVYTIFWISELYDPEDTDTYFEPVISGP
jgi:UDP-2-acetamido-2,6-beta-L-arabino-hexul-4-ose reductase